MTTFAEEYRPILMVVTFALLGWAFYVTYRSKLRSAAMTFNKIVLWTVTAVVVALLFFPGLLSELTDTGDQFTADMHRTVISIEGMT